MTSIQDGDRYLRRGSKRETERHPQDPLQQHGHRPAGTAIRRRASHDLNASSGPNTNTTHGRNTRRTRAADHSSGEEWKAGGGGGADDLSTSSSDGGRDRGPIVFKGNHPLAPRRAGSGGLSGPSGSSSGPRTRQQQQHHPRHQDYPSSVLHPQYTPDHHIQSSSHHFRPPANGPLPPLGPYSFGSHPPHHPTQYPHYIGPPPQPQLPGIGSVPPYGYPYSPLPAGTEEHHHLPPPIGYHPHLLPPQPFPPIQLDPNQPHHHPSFPPIHGLPAPPLLLPTPQHELHDPDRLPAPTPTAQKSFQHGPNVIPCADTTSSHHLRGRHPDIHPDRPNPFSREALGLPFGLSPSLSGGSTPFDGRRLSSSLSSGRGVRLRNMDVRAGVSGGGGSRSSSISGRSGSGSLYSDSAVPRVGAVRCYWAFLKPRYPEFQTHTSGTTTTPSSSSSGGNFAPSPTTTLGNPSRRKFELEFVHLDPVLGVHMQKQKLSMIGRGVIEFIHPEEREQARQDLYNSTQHDNLEGSVTRVRFARLSRIRTILGCPPEDEDIPDNAYKYVEDTEYLGLDLSIHWACTGLVLGFFHAIRDIDPVQNNDPRHKDQEWSNYCGTSNVTEEDIEQVWNDTTSKIPYPDMDAHVKAYEPRPPPNRVFLIHTTEESPTRPNSVVFAWPPPRPRMPIEYGPMDEHGRRRDMPELEVQRMDGKYWAEDYADLMKHVQLENKTGGEDAWGVAGKTSCTRRFQGAHIMMNEGLWRRVESYFIPYGNITFACFQTTETAPLNPTLHTARIFPLISSPPQPRLDVPPPPPPPLQITNEPKTLPRVPPTSPPPPRTKVPSRAASSRTATKDSTESGEGPWSGRANIPMATRGRVVPTALPADKKAPKELKQALQREAEKRPRRKSTSTRQASTASPRRATAPTLVTGSATGSAGISHSSPSGSLAPLSAGISRGSARPSLRGSQHPSSSNLSGRPAGSGGSVSPRLSEDAALQLKRLSWEHDEEEDDSDDDIDNAAADKPSASKRAKLDEDEFSGTPLQLLQAQTKAAQVKAQGKSKNSGGGSRPKGGSKKKAKAGEPPPERIQIPPPDGIPCCINCLRKESPEWRKSENGLKELCNACGLKLARIAAKLEGRGRKGKASTADDVNAELLEMS